MRYLYRAGFLPAVIFLMFFIACGGGGGNSQKSNPPPQSNIPVTPDIKVPPDASDEPPGASDEPPGASDEPPGASDEPPGNQNPPGTSAAHDIQPDELQKLINSGDVEVFLKSDEDVITFIGGKDLRGIFPNTVNSVKDAINALYNVKTLLGISDPSSEFTGIALYTPPYGYTYKLQQIYKNVPVYARMIIINTDSKGVVLSLISDYYRNIDKNLSTTTNICGTDAEEIAKNAVISEIEKKSGGSAGINVATSSELVIYTLKGQPEVLACRVTADAFMINNDYFIDQSLTPIDVISNIRSVAVKDSGFDLLGQLREITVDEKSGKRELFDPERNIKIYKPDYNVSGAFKGELLIDSDDPGWLDDTSVSAMANISEVFDFYKNKLGRDSIDGDGVTPDSAVIHYKENKSGGEYKGAYWNGSYMVFGDGEPYAGYLDVVAHEFTHGVVDYTAGLIYRGQSGAIQEGYADIFGELIEIERLNDIEARSHAWVHGQYLENPRSLENPNVTEGPKEVNGLYYVDPFCANPEQIDSDYCGVHINSSIISYAAYLMWEREEFTKTELAKLWYFSLYRLTPVSEFSNVRYALIAAARLLKMTDSQIGEINAIFNAVEIDLREWDDSIPGGWLSFDDPEKPEPPENLTATEITLSSIRLEWTASPPGIVSVAEYYIYRDGVHIVSTVLLGYNDIDLTASTEYCYEVSALSDAIIIGKESDKTSPPLCVTTLSEDTEKPSVPQNLTASAVSTTEIMLNWEASTDNVGVAGYKIYRDDSFIVSSMLTSLEYKDLGLTHSTQYCYQVSAFDDAGNESDKSVKSCAVTLSVDDPIGIGVDMVFVSGGTFMMGCTKEQLSADCYSPEKPAHEVTLNSFSIGRYEITQAQWKAVMGAGSNPSNFKGDNLPVEMVSWNDIQEFIKRLNDRTGKNYRLPTEAEWEFAARGGNQSNGYIYSGSSDIGEVAWYGVNSGGTTHLVGTKKANELGIYDMSGNVYEWVNDLYNEYGYESQTNPTGPSVGANRVDRGGSWYPSAWSARVSFRDYLAPDSRNSSLGFRLAE